MGQHSKLYNNKRWRKKRHWQLQHHPLCADCEKHGKVTAATIADHVVPHRGDETLFWHGELQSLCKRCHDSHKQRLETSGVASGCDVTGKPAWRADWQ